MRNESELERRQRMAETAAYQPLTTGDDWELDLGSPLWPESTTFNLRDFIIDVSVDALPEPMRSVVELRVWGRYTFEEIARELRLSSRGHAHVLWTRALGKLADTIPDQGETK